MVSDQGSIKEAAMMKLGAVAAVVGMMATVGVTTAGAALAPLSATDHLKIKHPTELLATVSSEPSSKVITVTYAVDCTNGSLTGHFLASSGEQRELRLPKDAVKSKLCTVAMIGSIKGYGSIHETLNARGK